MSIRTILLPHDGSALSGAVAISLAPLIARAPTPVHVVVLHVPMWDPEDPVELDVTERVLRELGAHVTREHRAGPDAAAAILSVAGTLPADLVAMTTHGRGGPSRWVRGSVAERVLRACPVPLWMANPRSVPTASVRSILLPMDGSACASGILDPMVRVLAGVEARVTFLYVDYAGTTDTPALVPVRRAEREAEVRKWITEPMQRLQRAGIPHEVRVVEGSPAEEILRAAESGAYDLLAMSTHGRTGPARWVLGSVAEKVLSRSAIDLLLVRAQGS